MRVGFITADLSHQHGWAHYSLETLQALHNAGVELRVVAAHNSPPLNIDGGSPPALYALPSLVPRQRALFAHLMRALPAAARFLDDCDIIHCTVEPFAPLGAMIAGKRPFFQGGVGSYLRIGHWQRFPLTQVYRRALMHSHLICISHYTERVAQQELPGIRSSVVPLGIDASRFADLPPLQQPKRGPTILTVGGVKPRKGTLELVHAVAVVRETIPEVQCIVAGNTAEGSEYTRRVRETITALDLQDTVHLVGFLLQETLMAWYGAADVFVLPSINESWTFEGFGLVHMEASAAGLPVIGTTECGAEDAIEDGVTGFLVPQSQVREKLPEAILHILGDPELGAQMGRAGQQRAQQQTWARVAAQTIALYRKALPDPAQKINAGAKP